MTVSQTRVSTRPQLIPTNAGTRTWAAPPAALQEATTPTDLFYVRNHWNDIPQIDVDSYRLAVDGQVERNLSLSLAEVQRMPQKRFQVTFECCGNSPVPEYWASATRTSSIMEQV